MQNLVNQTRVVGTELKSCNWAIHLLVEIGPPLNIETDNDGFVGGGIGVGDIGEPLVNGGGSVG